MEAIHLSKYTYRPVIVSLVYAFFGIFWIIITDWLVDTYFEDFRYYSTIKGIIFIFFSTVIIYFTMLFLMNRQKRLQITLDQEKKQMETLRSEISAQNERLYRMIDESPVPMILHAENKRILRVSKTFSRTTGYEKTDVPTINAWAKKAFRNQSKMMYQHLESLYSIRSALHEGSFTVTTKDNKKLLWDFYSSYIGVDESGLRNVITVAIDITQAKKYESTLEYQSQRDALTNLFNRTHFNQITDEKIEDIYVLLMCDINGLKLINDLYGHSKGDALLKYYASLLKLHLPKESQIFRISGDEFAAILPPDYYDEMRNMTKSIQKALLESELFDVHVSSAFGYALKRNSDDTSKVYLEAENNLFTYKSHNVTMHGKLILKTILHKLYQASDETSEHVTSMTKLAKKMYPKLDLDDQGKEDLELLIKLHDIGKISVSSNIFTLSRRLNDVELDAIKKHPEYGYRIAHAIPQLKRISYGILTHHENVDGSGYPFGLKGKDIPLNAKILRIIDSYDTMISGRAYKEKMTTNQAVMELKRYAGIYYDRSLLELFLDAINA